MISMPGWSARYSVRPCSRSSWAEVAERTEDEADLGLLADGVDEHLALAASELDVVRADEADDLGALADAVVGREDGDAGVVGLDDDGTMPSTSLGVTMMASLPWAMNCWMTATSVARSPLPFWRSSLTP